MTRRRALVAVLAGALALTAGEPAGAEPAGAEPGSSARGGLPFVFTSDRDGDTEIYYQARTGRVVQLTRNTVEDFAPAFSPDGRRIAFVSTRDGDEEIYVMPLVGGFPVRQLTRNSVEPGGGPARDTYPARSPDGQRIAFASNRQGGETEIYVMDSDGDNVTRLTNTEPFVFDNEPTWSPDGRYIAFTSSLVADFNVEICRIRADGSDLRRLTASDDEVFDSGPDWSPDGRHIVFNSNRAGRLDSQDLFVMDADGGHVRPLVANPDGLDDVFARWAAGGARVVFSTFAAPDGSRSEDIWTVDADGSGLLRINRSPAADLLADPRPTTG